MALDILAQEYAAEESVTATQTATVLSAPKDINSDDSSSEETDDTVVVNESYIDKLIKENQKSADNIISPKQNKSYGPRGSVSHHQIKYHHQPSMGISPKQYPSLAHQPSQDFLLMVEHLQTQLHQKDEALKKVAKQLRQKRNDYDGVLRTNNNLKTQIHKLTETDNELNKSKKSHAVQISTELIEKHEEIDALNNKIAERDQTIETLTDEMEKYREVEEWLAMQMKWDNISIHPSTDDGDIELTVKTLEAWKYCIMNNIGASNTNTNDLNDDEKEPVKEAKIKETVVQETKEEEEDKEDNEEEESSKAPLLRKKQEDKKHKAKADAAIEKEMASTPQGVCYRCVPWFIK